MRRAESALNIRLGVCESTGNEGGEEKCEGVGGGGARSSIECGYWGERGVGVSGVGGRGGWWQGVWGG